jgi:hypothetical protein
VPKADIHKYQVGGPTLRVSASASI